MLTGETLEELGMQAEEMIAKIRGLLKDHHKEWNSSIPLIASENLTSAAVREAVACDFSHRYAEGVVGERVYAGCKYIDEVEQTCLELMKDVFDVPFADVRPISGVVANVTVYTAFTEAGDIMMAISIPVGGHISSGPRFATTGALIGGTAGYASRLNVKYLPYDRYGLNIDTDAAIKAIRDEKPKLVQFGASVFLFPHPVKELAEVAHEVGAHVNYDAAHVAGLIAAGRFQDPIREGADTMTMSTHKTLFGPQKGAVIARTDEWAEQIQTAAFPGMTSNHHLHNVAGLAVALAEFQKFGDDYANQVITNAKKLAESLYERGLKVVCPEKGFTESHTLLIDISDKSSEIGLGGDIEKLLERAKIIVNRNLLPWDLMEGRHYKNPGGIRLGTSEVTRLGMKESEMDTIAELIKMIIIDQKEPGYVANEVTTFREEFQDIHYSFPSKLKAFEYIEMY